MSDGTWQRASTGGDWSTAIASGVRELLYPPDLTSRGKQQYAQRHSTIENIKRRRGCTDCGKHEDTQPLEFHHVNAQGYRFAISDGLMRPWKQVWAEIQKCIVLCRACHVKRHTELHKIEGPQSRYAALRTDERASEW